MKTSLLEHACVAIYDARGSFSMSCRQPAKPQMREQQAVLMRVLLFSALACTQNHFGSAPPVCQSRLHRGAIDTCRGRVRPCLAPCVWSGALDYRYAHQLQSAQSLASHPWVNRS